MGNDHNGRQCQKGRECGIEGCQKFHARQLHSVPHTQTLTQTQTTSVDEARRESSNVTVCMSSNCAKPSFVALRTIPVILKNDDKEIRVNALLDDASTKTYINRDIAEELGLFGESKSVTVNVLDGQYTTFETMPVNLQLESIDGQKRYNIDAYTTNRVTGNLSVMDWRKESQQYPHLRDIHFHRVNNSRPIVDILLGSDHPAVHQCIAEKHGKPGEPFARLGPLGWTCIGKTTSANDDSYVTFFVNDGLSDMLREFWETEERGSRKMNDEVMSTVETKVLKETENSMKYDGKRYEVGLPWNEKKNELKNNENMAEKRLKSTERKLGRQPEVRQVYQENIQNYLKKGYINKVTEERDGKTMWAMPHFPVVHLDKETTKVRMVFDASAKQEELSLNDAIHQGPKLQNNLFEILLRFRKHPIALICDIQEMYLQIGVIPSDRQYLRFLWRANDTSEIETYEFNRLVFGVNASPFLAQLVAKKNAETYREEFPVAAETVLSSTYMDDSLDSTETEEQGIELYRQVSALWMKAGIFARKWLSNSQDVLKQIPEQDQSKEVNLDASATPGKKTLGVLWQAQSDMFTFRVNTEKLENVYT